MDTGCLRSSAWSAASRYADSYWAKQCVCYNVIVVTHLFLQPQPHPLNLESPFFADLFMISFNQSTYTTSEGEDSVEVCLVSDVRLPEAVLALLLASEVQDPDYDGARGMAFAIVARRG